MNWLRLYTEITRDHKLRRLPPSHRWLWVAILCLARQSHVPGYLLLAPNVPITIEDLADEANISIEEVEAALVSFQQKEMIHVEDQTYVVSHWHSRQFESDDTSERVKRWRERRNIVEQTDVTLHQCCSNDNVTPPDTDTDTDTDAEETCMSGASEYDPDQDTDLVAIKTASESRLKAVKSNGYSAEFEDFWREYPRHIGKQEAWRKYKVCVKQGVIPAHLKTAAKNYRDYCEKRRTDVEHIKHAATFLGPGKHYEDFLNGLPEERNYQLKNTRGPVKLLQPTDIPDPPPEQTGCENCGHPWQEWPGTHELYCPNCEPHGPPQPVPKADCGHVKEWNGRLNRMACPRCELAQVPGRGAG